MPTIKNNMKKPQALFFPIALVLVLTAPVYAVSERILEPKPVSGQFESDISAKLTRGITNVLFGWTEIARSPVRIGNSPKHGALTAAAVGIPYGIFRAVARTVVGVYETVTFFAPQGPVMEPIEGDVV